MLEEREQLCRLVLLSDNTGGAMRFIELGGELFAEYYKKFFGNIPPKKLEDFYRFVSSGCVACLKERLRQEERSPVEQFADEMSEFITKDVRCLL